MRDEALADSPVTPTIDQSKTIASPIANHLPVRSANGGMARVSQAPGLILAAPDALARPVAMEIRTATAQRERRRDRRCNRGGKNDDAE